MTAVRVYVGTVGQSVFRSEDGGRTFVRRSAGLFPECEVRALAVHPQDDRTLFLGTDMGVWRSTDGGERWERRASPLDRQQIWSLAIDPRQPETVIAGTCPAALWRSRDAGETWEPLDARMAQACAGNLIVPRVTCVLFDPEQPGTVWAGVEIDGVYRSRDGGETWEKLHAGLSSQDIHGLVVLPGPARALLATTNNDVNRSVDEGETWTPLGVREHFPWPYTRCIGSAPDDPEKVYVGAGNGPPGNQGGLFRTRDRGRRWEPLHLPGPPNSTIWNLAFHPADPRRIYAASISGYVYVSEDGGDSWAKLPHEFGEIRALAWVPA